MSTRIIPAIDLMNGECVRLLQGDPDQKTVYSPDPASVAEEWVAQGAQVSETVQKIQKLYKKNLKLKDSTPVKKAKKTAPKQEPKKVDAAPEKSEKPLKKEAKGAASKEPAKKEEKE